MLDSDQKWCIHPADLKCMKALGEGGFGIVRKCLWSHGGVRAVKFFKNLSSSGIELQRKVLNQILDHSRILLPVGYGISSAGHHIIMTDFAEYGDLQTILERHRPLPLPRRVQMAVEIAEGMHYLHSKEPKILHLDLKPANILVFRDYAVKIGDLGLAEVVEKGDGIPSEYYKGTIPYAAPEAIAAAHGRSAGEEVPRLTTKTDVFSFGVLLYQLVLAGKVKTPFSAEMGEVAAAYPSHYWDLHRVRHVWPDLRPKLPPPSDDIPEPLHSLIERCWSGAPEDRPEFKDVLDELYSIQATFRAGGGRWMTPAAPPYVRHPASSTPATAHPPQAGRGRQQLFGTLPRREYELELKSPFDAAISFSMSMVYTYSALQLDDLILLRAVFSEEGESSGRWTAASARARLAEHAREAAERQSRPPMVARWLVQTLKRKEQRAAAAAQAGRGGGELAEENFSIEQLLVLANNTKKGWADREWPDGSKGVQVLDMLPLSYQGTDWLVGTWGAMRDGHTESVDRAEFLRALHEAPEVQREDARQISDAVGSREPLVLGDVLEALRKAGSTADIVGESIPFLEQQMEIEAWARVLALEDARKAQWEALVTELDFARGVRDRLGERYSEAMFMPPVLVTEEERERMFKFMRVSMQLWDTVEAQHRYGLLPHEFFARNNRWLLRAVEYRHLVEPLDIANWYIRNYQWVHAAANGCAEEGYHYADGITDELRDNNERRPDRYLLLQQMEVAADGSAKSSLGAAHRLKALLGNRRWQDVAAAAPDAGQAALCCPHCGSLRTL